jgi:hypothetical protein
MRSFMQRYADVEVSRGDWNEYDGPVCDGAENLRAWQIVRDAVFEI